MKINITYVAQINSVAGCEAETLDFDNAPTVAGVIDRLVTEHGETLREMLLTSDGSVRPSILIFAGEDQVAPQCPEPLTDGQTLTLLSPLAGG